MAGERYNEEFKIAAVKQVTENGYSVADVARRSGVDLSPSLVPLFGAFL